MNINKELKKKPKITIIHVDDEPEHRNRPGFKPACCYGPSMCPGEYEVGGIFEHVRNPRIEHGLMVHDATCIERISINPSTIGVRHEKETQVGGVK